MSSTTTADEVALAYKAGRELPPEKLTVFYDEWALRNTYDKFLFDAGYRGPTEVASHLSRQLADKSARILDVGCGTGLVGEQLQKLGYTNLTALDPSKESLNVSRSKGCYQEFIQDYVRDSSPLELKDDSFDGAVSCGAFCTGHCDGSSLREMIRLVKPGGPIVIGTRRSYFDDEHEGFDFRKVADELVAEKVCSYYREDVPNYSQSAMGITIVFTVN